MLPMLMRIASLLPTAEHADLEESQSLQQFSTPIGLAYVASVAAAITPSGRRAGTFSRHRPSRHLCRSSPAPRSFSTRSPRAAPAFSRQIFPAISTTQFDAAHINDHLDARHRAERCPDEPAVLGRGSCRSTRWRRRHCDISARRLARLPEGGRLVTITGANVAPDNPVWTELLQAASGTRPGCILGGD